MSHINKDHISAELASFGQILLWEPVSQRSCSCVIHDPGSSQNISNFSLRPENVEAGHLGSIKKGSPLRINKVVGTGDYNITHLVISVQPL